MNIAIGKFGRTMKFDEKTWNCYAGDDSPKIIYFELARRHPEHTFYIINCSDFTKFKKNNEKKPVFERESIPENIVDFHQMAKDKYPYKWEDRDDPSKERKYPWGSMDQLLEDTGLKFDLGLFMQGMDFELSINGVGLKRQSDGRLCKFLGCTENYVSKMLYIINKQKFKWYNINEDPRYFPYMTADLFQDEEFVFSQANAELPTKRILGYGDDSLKFRPATIKYKYSGIERMFLASKTKVDFTNPDDIVVGDNHYQKSNKFIMTLNEGTNRLEFLEKYVFNFEPDTKIYGRWKEEKALKRHPDSFIEKAIIDMEPEMWSTKYTYVPCFDKSKTNFVTQKPWKCWYYGILTFWDKNSYDTDNYYNFIPDFFKVETPEEMWEKINYLENNKEEYKKYLKMFYDILEDKYFNGDYIEEVFGEVLK